MKTKLNPQSKAGSALLVTLFLMTILAVSIAGYLTYTEQQSYLGARAQSWNMALAVSEAGVEEGLQQLNMNYDHLTADGWTANGTVYSITRTFSGGNNYTVSIDYSNSFAPTIVSRSFVNPPTLVQNSPTAFFAATGVNTTTGISNVTRAVRVTCSRNSLFRGALVARHKIDMNGNNVLTDSFDSADPAKSTSGLYDVTKAGDNGDVASNDGVVNTVSAGNANIYGHVYTGPGGTATVGVNGGVGQHSWQAGHTGIEDGYYFNNANFTFPYNSLPYNSGTAPGPLDVVSISGASTNSSTAYVNVTTPPGALEAGMTRGPVTTNTISSSSSSYPGSQPGMTTNTTWVTVGTYPGSQPGMSTNLTGFTTVTTYPGPQPGLSTNCASSSTRVKNQPTSGWCGATPWQGSGNDNNWWFYYAIASYTYANQFSYTYASYTYNYTGYTYTYTEYTSTPLYVTNHYDHVLATGDYYTSDLSGTTLVTGTARLVMPDGLNMSGNDQVTIATGGSLTLYSGGNSLKIGGNGIMNNSGYAANLQVFATPSVTSFSLDGNGTFIGVVAAPEANLTLNGGGSTAFDIIGSVLVNSVKFNGHFNFHYDEALGRLNTNGRFLITRWDEIP